MKEITIFENFTTVLGYRSLPKIVKAIREGAYKDKILSIRRAVARGDKKLVDQLKKQLQAFTVSGKFEGGRTMKHLVEYYPLVILDIDKVEASELQRITKEASKIEYTHIAFLSPSGKGCKIIVKIDSSFPQHQEAFKQVVDFYETKLSIKVDQSGKDIMRLCFFSYDPDIFYNKKSKVFTVKSSVVKPLFGKAKSSSTKNKDKHKSKIVDQDILDRLDQALELTKIKLVYTPGNRNNFIYLFACNCNREGLSVSDVVKYSKDEFDIAESELVATVKSAFVHHEKEYGNSAMKKSAKQWQFLEDQESFYSSLLSTPCFPSSVYQQLPSLLKQCCDLFNTAREKDVFLTGALGVLSGALSNMKGIYDGRTEYSNIFSFIIAPPANGKGAMKYAAMLGGAFHQKLLEERKIAMANYKREMTQYHNEVRAFSKDKKKEFPKEPEIPELQLFFIPANSSSAMIIKHLQESGGTGVIFETEADTLGNVLKQDWGGFSDLLRKAFHFEPISYSRKSNDEYIEIRSPRLSVVLSGTPSQIFQLIPSAEDGLYSRFCFYAFNSGSEWRNVKSSSSNELHLFFGKQSNKVHDMVQYWKTHPAQFTLADDQWDDLNRHFGELLQKVSIFQRGEAMSIVKRMALILFRLAMLLTAIRNYEESKWTEKVVCQQQDYEVAKSLVEVFRVHSFFLLGLLGKPKGVNYRQLPNRKLQFYEKLPLRFQRKIAIEVGRSIGISRATIDRWLKQMTGEYLEQFDYGLYEKINSEKVE